MSKRLGRSDNIPIEEFISEPKDFMPRDEFWFLCPKCRTIRYAYRSNVACPDCLNVMILWGIRTIYVEKTFAELTEKVSSFLSKREETVSQIGGS